LKKRTSHSPNVVRIKKNTYKNAGRRYEGAYRICHTKNKNLARKKK